MKESQNKSYSRLQVYLRFIAIKKYKICINLFIAICIVAILVMIICTFVYVDKFISKKSEESNLSFCFGLLIMLSFICFDLVVLKWLLPDGGLKRRIFGNHLFKFIGFFGIVSIELFWFFTRYIIIYFILCAFVFILTLFIKMLFNIQFSSDAMKYIMLTFPLILSISRVGEFINVYLEKHAENQDFKNIKLERNFLISFFYLIYFFLLVVSNIISLSENVENIFFDIDILIKSFATYVAFERITSLPIFTVFYDFKKKVTDIIKEVED